MGTPLPLTNEQKAERTYAAVDLNLFEKQSGWRLKLGQYRKHPSNPLFLRDAPWEEGASDHVFGQIVRDPRNGLYHAWYAAAKMTQKGCERNTCCYAMSRDGVRFAKPGLGLHGFDGSTDNNIWTTADYVESCGVAGFFEDPHDPDPQRRYKRPYPKSGVKTPADEHAPRGLHVATSPDLVHWTDTPETPIVLRRGVADTFNHGWWDPDLNRYVIITRTHIPVEGFGGMRSVGRIESEDFHHWSPLETVFVEIEPGETVRQYYAMPTWRYAGGYVGLLYVFHSKPTPEHDGDTPMDIELAWSPDSVEWQEVAKGTPLIERGEKGSFDAGRMFGLWTPIDLPHELRVYYGGCSLGKEHTFTQWKTNASGVGLAQFRKDGLAMLETQNGITATATTRLIQIEKHHRFIALNADASNGRVRVGLHDVLGSPIRGYSIDDCEAMTRDSICHMVSFNGNSDLAALAGRRVRVVMEADNARFFALRCF